MSYCELYKLDEKLLVIMVLVWNEMGVIGNMVELVVIMFDYENYYIFVGIYFNDFDIQCDVDEVCVCFLNVYKVVCVCSGFISKVDCLNNVLDVII